MFHFFFSTSLIPLDLLLPHRSSPSVRKVLRHLGVAGRGLRFRLNLAIEAWIRWFVGSLVDVVDVADVVDSMIRCVFLSTWLWMMIRFEHETNTSTYCLVITRQIVTVANKVQEYSVPVI